MREEHEELEENSMDTDEKSPEAGSQTGSQESKGKSSGEKGFKEQSISQAMEDVLNDTEDSDPMLLTTQGEISKLESDVFGLLQSLVMTLSAIVLLFTFVCPITRVSGVSMEPTLVPDEVLMVWSLFNYEPEVHDIVIVTDPTFSNRLEGHSIVKRVIALEGQTVSVDYSKNQVAVDGIPLYEPYILEEMRDIYGLGSTEFVVPEDCIFVLGDNRNHSSDSRDPEIGMVQTGYVKGKVILGVWPMSSWRVF